MIRAGPLRRALRDASTDKRRSSFAFPVSIGSTYFLAISDQTDVGISGALHAGLGFFGPPNAAPPDPPCGKVCPATSRARLAAFPCPAIFTSDDLGSLYTPAVQTFASGHFGGPDLTAYLLVQALNSLLWLVRIYDACERSFNLTMSSHSSAPPD